MCLSSTSSSNGAKARKFALRVALFLSPFLLIAGLFEAMVWGSGDAWPLGYVLQAQAKTSTSLYGVDHFSQSNRFKLERIRALRPEIVAVGSSRVMQMRGFFFGDLEAKFYNGGGLINGSADLQAYAKALEKNELPRPQVILLGLDPWWFTEAGPRSLSEWFQPHYQDPMLKPESHLIALRSFFHRSGLPWPGRLGRAGQDAPGYPMPAYGSSALLFGAGFRSDGSYQYRPSTLRGPATYIDRESPPVLARIQGNLRQFKAAPAMSGEAISLFLLSIATFRDLGIEVYVFYPPFSSVCEKALADSPTLHEWWRQFREDLPSQIVPLGAQVLPYETTASLGLNDESMWDGYHPSEVIMATIVRNILRTIPAGSGLQTVRPEAIDAILARPRAHPLSLEQNPPSAY